MTIPNGVERPGIVIGAQNGSAHTSMSSADTRPPSESISSPRVIAVSGKCFAR